jgi:hypothetical protein
MKFQFRKQTYVSSLGYTKILFYVLFCLFLVIGFVLGIDAALPVFIVSFLLGIYNGVGHVYVIGALKCSSCAHRVGKSFNSSNVSDWPRMKREIVVSGQCPHCGHEIFTRTEEE